MNKKGKKSIIICLIKEKNKKIEENENHKLNKKGRIKNECLWKRFERNEE